jgi:hypothetical protein
LKFDEVLYEIKDTFARGRGAIFVGAFVKSINDEINWAMIWESEHFL